MKSKSAHDTKADVTQTMEVVNDFLEARLFADENNDLLDGV